MSSDLIFTRSSTVPVAHIAPVVVAAFVAAQASIAATFPSRLGSDRSKARSLVNQPSRSDV
ncbi:hypothetical protein QUA54_28770 [Microcoleus sp. MOSTC5]|uniref:hypothetical protein n=1 Tax=Microcoleus sp. MOSTC5 TaxID=3055378 RepID=UPI002FD728B9